MQTESHERQPSQPVVPATPAAVSPALAPPAEALPIIPDDLMAHLQPSLAEYLALAEKSLRSKYSPETLRERQARFEEAARLESALREQRDAVRRETLGECRQAIDQLQRAFTMFAGETEFREILEQIHEELEELGERYVTGQIWRS